MSSFPDRRPGSILGPMETRNVDTGRRRTRVELPMLAVLLAGIIGAGPAEPTGQAGEVRPPSTTAAGWVPEQHNQVLR